jgi:large subunit ribosomal protein L5
MNKMRELEIKKVVINISVGEAGEKLLKAENLLKMLTSQKPVQTKAKSTIKDWGIREGLPIAVKVTLRGNKAEDFMKRAFWTKNNKVSGYSFDEEGNFSMGIGDYSDFEKMKYDPDIGVFGMDISVLLRRKGSRIEKRKPGRRKIPRRHRITREEGMEMMKQKFSLEVIG